MVVIVHVVISDQSSSLCFFLMFMKNSLKVHGFILCLCLETLLTSFCPLSMLLLSWEPRFSFLLSSFIYCCLILMFFLFLHCRRHCSTNFIVILLLLTLTFYILLRVLINAFFQDSASAVFTSNTVLIDTFFLTNFLLYPDSSLEETFLLSFFFDLCPFRFLFR